MVRGTTESGFEYEICDEALDDYELFEILSEIDNGDTSHVPQMIALLLGNKQKDLLKEHCRVNGRVSSERMLSEITEILLSNESGKN